MTRECQTCNDPTKHPWAFWDGKDGSHGQLYSCYNLGCKIRQNQLKETDACENNKLEVEAINHSNLIFMNLVAEKRRELQISIKAMSDSLGIRCSLYSDYEQQRKPLPAETMDKINGIFKSRINPT